jgi:hypothetical protein
MSPLERQLIMALAETLALIDTRNLSPEQELIYVHAVEILTDAMDNCSDCVNF